MRRCPKGLCPYLYPGTPGSSPAFAVSTALSLLRWDLATAEESSSEVGEEGGKMRQHPERFTCAMCAVMLVMSLLIKELQQYKDVFARQNPITYEMVGTAVEEFVATGGIGLCFVILRMNPFGVDVVMQIAELRIIHVGEIEVDQAIEQVHCLIFSVVGYFFLLVLMCVLLITQFAQRDWDESERWAQQHPHDLHERDSAYLRLRWSFFNTRMPQTGVRKLHSDNQFNICNLSFRRYMEVSVARTICEVIKLRKSVILAPLFFFGAFYLVRGSNEVDKVSTEDHLRTSVYISCGLLVNAVLLRLHLRRVFLRVRPARLGCPAAFLAEYTAGPWQQLAADGGGGGNGAAAGARGYLPLVCCVSAAKVLPPVVETPVEPRSQSKESAESNGQTIRNLRKQAQQEGEHRNLSISPSQAELHQRGSESLSPLAGPKRVPSANFHKKSRMSVTLADHEMAAHGRIPQNAQESLFFAGPTFVQVWIQGSLFFVCVAVAIFQRIFDKELLAAQRWLHGLFWAPLPATTFLVYAALFEYSVATSLEMMTHLNLLEEVLAETKETRLCPFVGTTTSKRLVSQMKYEAVLHKYQGMGPEECAASINSPETREKIEATPGLERAFMHSAFASQDHDDSGSIERKELVAVFVSMGFSAKTSRRIVEDWMDIYDTDKSGHLSLSEFEVLHLILVDELQTTVVQPTDCLKMCRRLDLNDNGKLSSEEMATAFQEWLGLDMKMEDVRGVFATICPDALKTDEIETETIAKWIYRIYEISSKVEESEKDMLTIDGEGGGGAWARASTTTRSA